MRDSNGDGEGDGGAPTGNMRPCGCHRGRPCTCEMGRRLRTLAYACGECTNCQLNARALKKKRKATRKCVKYDAFMAEKAFERLELAPGCTLRVGRPDWDVAAKSAFYTRMRQLRFGLQALRIESAIEIEKQKALRKKYNRDLIHAEEALRRMEEARSIRGTKRRMTADMTHVDSDVFDSFSKQRIPTEILLPDVRARIEAANETISTHERNLEVVELYVNALAATRLQISARAYIRSQRWKRLWQVHQEDVSWAAVVTIQAAFRMSRHKQTIRFLKGLRAEAEKRKAAECLFAFFCRIRLARLLQAKRLRAEALDHLKSVKTRAASLLLKIAEKIVCRVTFWLWRARHPDATAHDEHKVNKAVLVIQRHWRGLRERLQYRRVRYRRMLSEPVRELYDRFVCHGDIWRLLFEIDATIKRYEQREHQEREDASTFVKSFLHDKRTYEDRIMQQWFHASALESPIVRGAISVKSAFDLDTGNPEAEAFSLAESIIQSPMSKELVGFNPTHSKSELFPDDLPPYVIRRAVYEGFNIPETVAVMRGLMAQGRDASNVKAVLQVLRSRAPLMRNAWKPERVVRLDARPLTDVSKKRLKMQRTKAHPRCTKSPGMPHSGTFLSNNMLANIPAGLHGAVDRLLFVAGLKCFDPSQAKFVFRLDASRDPWRSYMETPCPLTKIRREQVVHDAIKPHVLTLKSKRCCTCFDILHYAKGVEELVSWGLPRPLAMAVYDVIELLHEQTVNSSDKRIERQMRISAQFQVFAEKRQKSTRCQPLNKISQLSACSQPSQQSGTGLFVDIQEIADAINVNVLELPINDLEMRAQDVLFKAYFLICDDTSSDTTNQHVSFLSRAHYEDFLKRVLAKQTAGDTEAVQNLVRNRVHIASELAEVAIKRIQKQRMLRAADILRNGFAGFTEEVLGDTLRELLQPLSRDEAQWTQSTKPLASHKSSKPKMLPLIHRKHTSLSSVDATLRSVDIPR